MYPVTNADAAIFYTSISYHLERFFGMLVVFPHRLFVSLWMIEIISCFSFFSLDRARKVILLRIESKTSSAFRTACKRAN